MVEDICFSLGFRPYLLPPTLKDKPIDYLLDHPSLIPRECLTPIHRSCKVLIVEDDWDVVDEILVIGTEAKPAKLPYYIPKGAMIGRPVKNTLGHICQFNIRSIYGGNSIIKMDTEKSFKNDPGSFEGSNMDVVHYDEPKCKALRASLKRGLVDNWGYEWFTFTALGEGWMKNELYDKAGSNPEIAAFNFDTEDLIEAGLVSRRGWQEFADSLNEDEKVARIEGKWAHLTGLVYKEFQARDVKDGGHLCNDLEPEWVSKHGTCFLAVDPHPRNPMAALILVCDERGRWIVWREVFAKVLISEFCEMLDLKLSYLDETKQNQRQMVATQIMDPLGFIEDPVDGTTWADEFNACGYSFDKASKDKSRGILNVKQALKENVLVICRGCTRTIWEFQNYVFGDWSAVAANSRDPKERPVDKDDHMMENLYRLVNLQPFHIPLEDRGKTIEVEDLVPL